MSMNFNCLVGAADEGSTAAVGVMDWVSARNTKDT